MPPKKAHMHSKNSSNLGSKLDRHFLACSALAGMAAVTAQKAEATIQYSGLQNLSVPTTNGQGGIYIDMELFTHYNSITNGSQPGGGPGPLTSTWDFNFYQSRPSSGQSLRFYYNTGLGNVHSSSPARYSYGLISGTQNTNVSSGTLIDASSTWGQVVGLTNFYNNTGLMGVKFQNNANNTTLYGWIRLSGGAANGFPATIVDWAFEDSGAGITAGAVPEPGSIALGCLAAGAMGLTLWRKRKQS